MGASAREIEREIKETRERIDENLDRIQGRAAYNAVRYGRVAAVAVGVVAVAGVAFLIYRRRRKSSLKERLEGLSVDNLRELTEKLKEQFPSVTVTVNEKASEPGAIESVLRKVAPALIGTASSVLLNRVVRKRDEPERRVAEARAG